MKRFKFILDCAFINELEIKLRITIKKSGILRTKQSKNWSEIIIQNDWIQKNLVGVIGEK